MENDMSVNFEKLVHYSPIPTCILNEKFHIFFCNKSFCRISGYTKGDLAETPLADIFYTFDNDIGFEPLLIQLCRSTSHKKSTILLKKKSGEILPFVFAASKVILNRKNPYYICSIHDVVPMDNGKTFFPENIPQKKKAELEELGYSISKTLVEKGESKGYLKQIKESEYRYHTMAEAAQDMIFIVDVNGEIKYVNKFSALQFKTEPEHLVGKRIFDVFPAEVARRFHGSIKNVIQSRKTIYSEDLTPFPSGMKWIGTRIIPLVDDNNRVRSVMGVARDISQRIHIEEQLRKSKEQYQLIVENIKELVVKVDASGRFIYVSPTYCQMFGKTEQELIGEPYMPLMPEEDRAEAIKMSKQLQQPPYTGYIEQRALTREGWRWLSWSAKAIRNEQGEVEAVVVSGRDITERKTTELRLKESETRFRDTIERSIDAFYSVDEHNRFSYINKAFTTTFGYTLEDLQHHNFEHITTPGFKNESTMMFKRVMSGATIAAQEVKLMTKAGNARWATVNARRVIRDGYVKGIEGFLKDIHSQKKALEQLSKSEARYRTLFGNLPYEAFSINAHNVFSEANEKFLSSWGDVIGKRPDEAIPFLPVANLFMETLEKIEKQHSSLSMEYSIARNEHGTVYYQTIMSPVITRQGQLLSVVGVNIDITDQVNAIEQSKSLSAKLVETQEEERMRISKEIHDSIGQYLTALKLEIAAAEASLATDSARSLGMLAKAKKTVSETISIARNMVQNLRPPSLDDFGLIVALKDYINDYSQKWNIPVKFKTADLKDKLSKTAETAFFRITQEALTNVLKHAKAAKVTIRVFDYENHCHLVIVDNGVGFDLEALNDNSRTAKFGILGMKERAEFVEGSFDIYSKPGKGTKISVKIPLKKDTT
jgi:PAS domain S-box-containing protein